LPITIRRSFVFVVIAVVLLASRPAQGQQLAFELFSRYLDSLRDQAGIPGLAAAIVDSGGIAWEQAYGHRDVGRSDRTATDTPFHTDGLTQVFTASMVLRCVEERRLSLDDRVGRFSPNSAEPDATIRHLLTHTSGSPDSLVFEYRPERLQSLWSAVRACREDSYRETLANLLARLAMRDSAPGPDIIRLRQPAEGIPDPSDVDRYAGILQRLATPYAVDQRGRASLSQYLVSTLTPSSGLISTVRDFARFDLALREGGELRKETLTEAWRAPLGAGNQPLPHGLGWFVQSYNGETVVWQFGVSDGASSSLLITLPERGVTLIMLANSDRLVRPIPLARGDLTLSPFGRLFLNLFAR
jgi:CubicO group peptidase (beta-lactamase class C family)